MMILHITQHLSNIWSFIQEKVKQQRLSWKKKKVYKKAHSLLCVVSFNILIMQGLVIHRYENNLIIKQ